MTSSDRCNTRPRGLTSVALYLALLALSSGCSGSDPVTPERRLAGRYEAIIWTTDGEFFTPEGAAPQPPERMVSMEGTWNVTEDDVVTLRRRYSGAERNHGKPDYE